MTSRWSYIAPLLAPILKALTETLACSHKRGGCNPPPPDPWDASIEDARKRLSCCSACGEMPV